ncbi:putative ion transporter [Scheffersomyces stipitis CBS 6054]|uniref:Putative ion transporter n=1 Tax=Scheffersomyces stipitis (strain ATCC 58785 / CBS 6054 / NBRC 10063 / NRRL Y-11545) TaxID=322104 RepID=A3M0Q3_PICST|nr:putative ion transporter [Scheffersomyces stipitis CBS 6054]ABN68574.1 putative ion transporter [Scheffersomyces stipitis CBS 6054]
MLQSSIAQNENDLVPGTVHLVDIRGNLKVKKDAEGKNIILQPQPSSNVNDPLRWPQSKKIKQFSLLWIWAFLLAVSVNFSGPLWVPWSESFNCSFFQLNVSSALCFLFLGIGCLFLQPTALKLGRRFVYLVCTVIILISNIIGSQATNVKYLYVVNILGGFAAAPVDSLVEISSTDVFFQHERSTVFSLLILALYAGSDLGPVACGYIVEKLSWRWCYYIQIIIYGVLLIIQIFYMEDTTFRREYNAESLEAEILAQIKSNKTPEEKVSSIEAIDDISSNDTSSINSSIPKRTYWQRIKFIELEYNDTRSWLTIFYRPFLLISFPAIIWGGVLYGAQMMWLSLLATTQSEIYSASPYFFSVPQVGLTNLGACVGSLLGMVYGGTFVDYLALRLAKRNNGILEPEFRLWAMFVPTFFNAGGLLAYGLGSYLEAHWAVSVVVGQGLLGFAMSSSGAICLTYAVDSYPKVASEGLVLMLFCRNCIGMAFTFAIQPWLDRNGLSITTWLMFMLSLIINGSFLLMIKWGKEFRRWTAARYDKYSDPRYGQIF